MQTFTFGGTHIGSTNSKNRLLSRLAEEVSVSECLGTIDNQARRISYHNQSLKLVILTATMTMPVASVPPPAVTFRWLHYNSFLIFVPSKCQSRFTYRPATAILTPFTGTPSVSQLHNFRLVSAIGSASNSNPSSNNHRSFHLVWAISFESRQVRGLIAERNCGILWGRGEH